ncbi:MAG: hypothetical protein EAX87_10435 [Candidatus Thorarchaeota archaeon]|nr:hypothetical protein [Candidatus Thorarchaeota archaeon]
MITLSRHRIALVLMLTWFVITPYTFTISTDNQSFTPTATFELAAPTISGPSTYQFENGTTGLTIIYHANDPNPKNYTVTANGVELDNGLWSGGSITVYLAWLYNEKLIDTLPKTVTMVCTVFNDGGESASATTVITVILDESPPIIQQPENITYEVGSFGHEIRWNITEANPDFYNISRTSNEPTNNATVIESGPWINKNITINVDGLNVSRWYLYSLFVKDKFGLNATSVVNVTVVQDLSPPTITSPDDIAYEFGEKDIAIIWHAYDSNPKNFTIKAIVLYNDTTYGNVSQFHTFTDIIQSDWTFTDPKGADISADVSGLFLGNYTITLTLFDDFGRMTNDSVNVTVYPDIRAPIITTSGDLSYEEGYTGYSINWTVEESNPKYYNLTLNGVSYKNSTWHGEGYAIDVDGFEVGTYDYNMSYTDFFNQTAYAVIEVIVTPDAHLPTVTQVFAIQTFSTPTANNVSIHASVWDLNNISSVEVQWGVGDPGSTDFEPNTENMTLSVINEIYTANIGEFKHGATVWFKVVAEDNSSVKNIFDTGWIALEITSQGYNRVSALLYAAVVAFGSLSLLVVLVLYFKTRTR